MSKKHFIELADGLRKTKPVMIGSGVKAEREFLAREGQWTRDLYAIATVCHKANPRFNLQRWLGYINGECGSSGGAVKRPQTPQHTMLGRVERVAL